MPDLTQREIDLFKAKNFAHLVTLNEDGSAHSAPLWIDVGDDGLVLVNSAVGRKKDRNIRRDPRVVVSGSVRVLYRIRPDRIIGE